MSHYDLIVLGVGGIGSAAVYESALRGRKVLGLEQFSLVHDRGSSHGHTRVIREAYYEHPDYVPLVRRSFERWYDLEQRIGRHLLTECSCLNIGLPGGELIQGVLASARQHQLPVEQLNAREIESRFPAFENLEGYVGVLEHRAGIILVEEAIRAHCDLATMLGAEIHAEEAVLGWDVHGESVVVSTTLGKYRAARLIITAGPWASNWLSEFGLSLTLMRQVQCWFRPQVPALFRRDRFPIYILEGPLGTFYGLPAIDPRGHKIAQHYGGQEYQQPEQVPRTATPADEAPLRRLFRLHLPRAEGQLTDARVCMYTLSHDCHFVVDHHPRYPQVVVAAGLSGHGFKFAPLLGEILVDLAETGHTRWPIQRFRVSRFA